MPFAPIVNGIYYLFLVHSSDFEMSPESFLSNFRGAFHFLAPELSYSLKSLFLKAS